jgi:hypothetical protein
MSELVLDFALRFAKVVVALLVAGVIWIIAVGPGGATGSVELAILCFLAGAATVLLIESSPL